ncbi:HU family DNA-binding protein [Rhodovulum adriaticum]|uniref:DNA-binding protein HU-alpha n=1 Tax=Rhodovulum adriaticum TaxID=35804 RepID=A0A4R2NIF2_RHOAD|nr:HU family DNA-binding protein [Rhodovulum adriaticum]MBK1636573.1 hypothetical protein [Rhodovulum adriaticum]TCP21191.1 DNA-binding protein HU-alpha [Rhodovulum adriaticum]
MTKATTTRTRSTTAVRKATTARNAPDASVTEGAEQADTGAGETADELRKSDLIEKVVAASGEKKKHVKPVVEAMLAVLGQTVSEGRTMNLQPFGKLMVTNRKDKENGEVLITRIRRSQQAADQAAEEVKTPLAEPGEES